ncbi:MAG: phospholipase [Muribaculaceae bacterium]|nr:phospholipase [Muribaculaceae bacterium]
MTVSAILLGILLATGLVLYLHDRFTSGRRPDGDTAGQAEPTQPESQECCGMHITCEKDSLIAGLDKELLYYDDEELDRFAGRPADGYNETETEEFRDILLTLKPDEIAGWARSITMRGITLPAGVRDELLMIVSEARASLKQEQDGIA